MKINVEKAKPVTQAVIGDIAKFDDDDWLTGIWDRRVRGNNKYYFVSLTQPSIAWIKPCDLVEYLKSMKAVVYDGSSSTVNLD